MDILNFFNINYAWNKLLYWIQDFNFHDTGSLIKLGLIIVGIIILWKVLKNVFIAVIVIILAFIVYETYFNVPSNTKIIKKNDTQVEIQQKQPNKLEEVENDVRRIVNDVLK